MQFVIGHEFAHHRLGHLDDGTISYRSFRGSKIESRDRGWTAVRRDWEHEFSADIAAIDAVSQNPARHRMAQAAILFMIYLAFVETMIEHSNVALRDVDTHPPTVERLRKLILSFGLSLGVDTDWGEGAVKHVKNAASQLLDHDFGGRGIFGWYGSVYLGQWRGPELVDRVDF
jgi:hypothetical protein